jgi:transcriptional regulator with XRE-family HTH domain
MGTKDIGRKLQQAREDAGLSQEQLASMLGCAQSTLSNYEKGKRRLYLTQLENIAEILNRPIEYFLETSNSNNESMKQVNRGADSIQEPELLQIVNALYDLPSEQRRSVMDYIIWQKNRQTYQEG